MDLNDIYQSIATFWERISPLMFAHLIAFLAIRWIAGTRLNILKRMESYLASARYTKWKTVLDEFDLRPKLPYLIVIFFLIYLTLFNSLLIDSLDVRPVTLTSSELEFWEENRPFDQMLEIGTYAGNPNIKFWEIAYEKQNYLQAFRGRYPEQYRSSITWLITDYGKWLTYYKCSILFFLFAIVLSVIHLRKREHRSRASYGRIFALLIFSIASIAYTRYQAEKYIEKKLKAEMAFVATQLHVDPEAKKNRLSEPQIRQFKKNLCIELLSRKSNPRFFWWSRVLERFWWTSREFSPTTDDEFRSRYHCGDTLRSSSMGGCPPQQLLAQIQKISPGQESVGAAFALVETWEFVAVEGDRHFPMRSASSLPIAMTVLHNVDIGGLNLEQKVKVEPKDFVASYKDGIRKQYPQGTELSIRDLLRFLVSEGDGTAGDVLLHLIGGPEQATKYLRELAVEDMVVTDYELDLVKDPELTKKNWTSAEAAVNLLKLLQGGREGQALSPTSSALLLELMTNSLPEPKRIKGLLPVGTVVAHMTGTGSSENVMTGATSDVGLITLPDGSHLAVAIFLSDIRANKPTRENVIARIARAAWDCWQPAEQSEGGKDNEGAHSSSPSATP
jgi:beta-lactamase class A